MNHPSSARGSLFSPPPSTSRTTASRVYSGTPARQLQHATFKSVYLDINAAGRDSATVKLYARISVPTNASGSQQALILFPEGNLTLRSHDIHPLNSQGRPYAYPPESSPLIQRAGRALRLDKQLDEYYSEALEKTIIRSPTRPGTTPRRNTFTGLGPNCLGSVTVQNLNYAFLTPRYTPRVAEGTDRSSDGTASESRSSSRRMSFSAASLATPDGRTFSKYHCIIAMELVVPIINMPKISPYMMYLRIPKCMDNRVRVALPRDKEWNVFTQPSIDQQANSASTWEAEGFADDEGQPRTEEVVLKGIFQSSDTLVVRWSAKADGDASETGLERTAVQSPATKRSNSRSSSRSGRSSKPVVTGLKRAKLCHVEGDAIYTVHSVETEQQTEDGDGTVRLIRYVPLDIEYNARCVGFHHPGTETQLGVDLVLASAGEDPADMDWAEMDLSGHVRTDTAGAVEEEFRWHIDAEEGKGLKAWNYVSTNRQREAPYREHSPSPGGAAGRSVASLRRTDTLVTEGSSSGSSGPSLGQRRFGASNNHTSGEYEAPSARQPLPRGDIPEASAEDFSLGEPSGLDGSLTRRSVVRTSSDPFSSSGSSLGKAVSRQSSGDPDALQSQGSFSFSEAGSEPTNASGVESYMASPHRPRSRSDSYPTRWPSDPIVLHVDLLDVLATQRDPNPSTAAVSFTITGQILVLLPDETTDNAQSILLNLPLFRFPGADDQKCNLVIESATGNRGRGAFEVIADQKRLGLGSNGYQARELLVAPSAPANPDVTLAFSVKALGKGSIGQSNSLMSLLKNSLGYASPPGTSESPTQLRSPRRNTRSPETSIMAAQSLRASHEVEHDPASELKMPSPLATPGDSRQWHSQSRMSLTPIKNSNHRSTSSRSPNDQPSSLAWVDINVVVSPPPNRNSLTELKTTEQGGWSYVVHVRSSWPSLVGGGALLDCVEFGLPKFNSASTESTPHVAIRSVHVGGIPAAFDLYDNESDAGVVSSQVLSAFTEKVGNEDRRQGPESKWFAWTKINLPDGTIPSEGNMEIIYAVATKCKASRKASIDLLLPSFTIGVARMTVNVDSPADYTRRSTRTSLQTTPNTVDNFRDFTLTPYTRRQLSFTLSKQYFTARLMSTISTILRAFHFLLTASALYYIWITRQYPEGALGVLAPGSFSEVAFSPLAKLVNVTVSVRGKKPVSSSAASSTTVSLNSTSPTPSITRRPPKETYVPPDNLWGAWDTTQDPFLAVSEDPLEKPSDDPVAMSAGTVPSDSGDPAIPFNLGVLGTFTFTSLVWESDKYQRDILRIVRETFFNALSLLLALFHYPA